MTRDEVGNAPLLPWQQRIGYDVRRWEHYLPELHITIGRDEISAGMTVTAWYPTEGQYAGYTVIWSARWQDPVLSMEEALQIAYRGAAAALAEVFGVDVS